MKLYRVVYDIKTPKPIIVSARTMREAGIKARDRLLKRGLRKKDLECYDIEEGPEEDREGRRGQVVYRSLHSSHSDRRIRPGKEHHRERAEEERF